MMCLEVLFVSCEVISDSLWPHGLQRARLPSLSLSPGLCTNSCPLSWWCHITISSFVTPFSFCLQSFPASESFPTSWFSSGDQIIGVLALASILPLNIKCCRHTTFILRGIELGKFWIFKVKTDKVILHIISSMLSYLLLGLWKEFFLL